MVKENKELSVIERIEKINEMVVGERLSGEELDNIKGLVEEVKEFNKEIIKLEREIMYLERANESFMDDLNEGYEREEREYFLDDDNWD